MNPRGCEDNRRAEDNIGDGPTLVCPHGSQLVLPGVPLQGASTTGSWRSDAERHPCTSGLLVVSVVTGVSLGR